MDPRSWPLSIAATRRLLDLRPDRPNVGAPSQLVTLTTKELIMRGAVRVDQVVRKRRSTSILVSTQVPARPLPGAAALLAARLGDVQRRDLSSVIRELVRRHRRIAQELRAEAERELDALGLTTPCSRKVLGLFPQRYLAASASGEAWQRSARAAIDRGDQLAAVVGDDVTSDDLEALGPLLVLASGGLAIGARVTARARAAAAHSGAHSGADGRRHAAAGATPIVFPGDGEAGAGGLDHTFSSLDGLDAAVGGLVDDVLSSVDTALDTAFDGFDTALDSAFGAIDSAFHSIDSAVDGGFSDGGGSDGGGGGDGGGG